MNRTKREVRFFGVLLLMVGWLVLPATAAEKSRPAATVQPLELGDVRWTEGFWAERFERCRHETVPALWRIMEGTNYSQFLQNFHVAVGDVEGKYRGASFNDGEVYKMLEASIAILRFTNDPALDQKVDDAIALIARAQRPDGYIHTPVLVKAHNGDTNAVPFQDRQNFEMYNMGHLMTTACLHYQVTGKTNLLAVAQRAADFLVRTFEGTSPEAARSSVCPSHYMGIIDLYRTTGEPRYLNLAKRFFEMRGQITDGGDDNQDRVTFQQQTNIVGHAVRANYLYAGAADLFMETGDTNYWKPLEPIWQNLIGKKMYITGGCGALFDGASPYGSKDQKNITRVHQAYGRNYELPNATAHNETCANIGNVLWNWRMFLATGEGRFVDVAELALYNSVLSGVGLDGTNFFYTNPLRSTDPAPTELRWQHQRVPFLNSFCCPPNLSRTIAESAEYAYAKSADAIWVNIYGSSTLNTKLGDQTVRLVQETEYPWSGRVKILVKENGVGEFALKLRIPGWSDGASVKVNQRAVTSEPVAGYVELRRVWKSGDVVELELPMTTRLMEANPLVEEDNGQVAVQRGPIVYCLESADLPKGTKISDVSLMRTNKLLARYDQRLLGGAVVLEGNAEIRSDAAWSGQLYRPVVEPQVKSVRIRLIPYSLWANRNSKEMTVWMPLED